MDKYAQSTKSSPTKSNVRILVLSINIINGTNLFFSFLLHALAQIERPHEEKTFAYSGNLKIELTKWWFNTTQIYVSSTTEIENYPARDDTALFFFILNSIFL